MYVYKRKQCKIGFPFSGLSSDFVLLFFFIFSFGCRKWFCQKVIYTSIYIVVYMRHPQYRNCFFFCAVFMIINAFINSLWNFLHSSSGYILVWRLQKFRQLLDCMNLLDYCQRLPVEFRRSFLQTPKLLLIIAVLSNSAECKSKIDLIMLDATEPAECTKHIYLNTFLKPQI